jgi:dTDP-glucose 4,6-dehydratase
MQRIMVTGGAGFIGSAFVRQQLDLYPGRAIVNFDKMTYAGNEDNVRECDPARHTLVRGDIADFDAVMAAMKDCDAVVNFAAESHVDRSILGAGEFIETNVRGVYNIVEAARQLGVKRVILVSTDEVYGSIAEGSFSETDPVHPRNPYSAAKAGGEMLGMSYFSTFGLPVMITRGSNTYGPYQYPEKVLPLFVTNAIDREPLPLYQGGEHNVRDWLYVDDHARGIDLVLREGKAGEIYNIAGGNERENIELTHKILALTERGEDLIRFVPDRPGHDRRYSINAEKMKGLGWAPQMEWEAGMAQTVKWYQDNEWWWRKIKTGEYLEYYKRQYASLHPQA